MCFISHSISFFQQEAFLSIFWGGEKLDVSMVAHTRQTILTEMHIWSVCNPLMANPGSRVEVMGLPLEIFFCGSWNIIQAISLSWMEKSFIS